MTLQYLTVLLNTMKSADKWKIKISNLFEKLANPLECNDKKA